MKMFSLRRLDICTVLSILLLTLSASYGKVRSGVKCPIGFELASSEKMCYSLKVAPEIFSEKFKNCTANLYSLKEYNKLGLPKSNYSLWTDYKSQYPGGPYFDTSDTGGDVLDTTYEVNIGKTVTSFREELCVVIDPVMNFTAVQCDEKHYRYCLVDPYSSFVESCNKPDKGKRFFTPHPTCLVSLKNSKKRTPMKASWDKTQLLCKEKGGNILGRGWRYYNSLNEASELVPLNIISNPKHTMLRYDDETMNMIPPSDWNFNGSITNNESALYGALNDRYTWELVNDSRIFDNPVCEIPIKLYSVNLTVSINSDGGIILTVAYLEPVKDDKEKISSDDIQCSTDSLKYFPTSVSVATDTAASDKFVLKASEDGYYWCTHTSYKYYHVSDSNKVLYIREKDSIENVYSVKIVSPTYTLDKIDNMLNNKWMPLLEEYAFYYNSMVNNSKISVDMGTYNNNTIMNYKKSSPLVVPKGSIIRSRKLKRLYLDANTVLVHVTLNPHVRPVTPGVWDSIYVEYMKPVYYCNGTKKYILGKSYVEPDCKTYKCVGDYNIGLDTVIEAGDHCTLPTTVKLSTVLNISDITPTVLPHHKNLTTTSEPKHRNLSSHDESSSEEETTTVSPKSVENVTVTSFPRPPKPPSNYTSTTEQPTTELPSPGPTVRPPLQEQLDQVISDLEGLLNANNTPIMVEDIDHAFTQVDQILVYEELDIPGNLLHLLDDIGGRIDLNGSNETMTVRDNIALLLADAQPNMPVRGLAVAVRHGSDLFTNATFQIIRDDINSSVTTYENEVVVSLPASVSTSSHRVSFVVFRNDRAFQGGHELYSVNSRVLSININFTEFPLGEVIDIHLMPTGEPERNQSRTCAFWQFNNDGVTGNWSQAGCTFIRATEIGQLDTCRCDHLTHFAEILIPRTVFSEANEKALELLSVIGCCLSIFGLLLVGITAALFRAWRRDYSNKIWLQLCLSIMILSVCFLVVVFVKFHEGDIICLLVGVALHYSLLASFCWMLVAAILSYRRLVLVFSRDASHKLLRASAFAWGAPCAVVGILLSVAPQSYARQFEEKSPSGAFCYPSGLALWLAVYAPIVLMLLSNWTLFILIVRSVFGKRRPQNHCYGATNEAFRCASVSCFLVFLFGLPWMFGLFSFNVVAVYFFTILVTFQGFVLFFFLVIGNKKTRDLWLNKLKIKQTRNIPVTSSTYTNRSIGGIIPARGNQTPAAAEGKASRPRSLTSLDKSRFS